MKLICVEGLTTPLFLCKIKTQASYQMERERLKLIVKNLKLLVESLEAEVYSEPEKYMENASHKSLSYEDVNDDDGEF